MVNFIIKSNGVGLTILVFLDDLTWNDPLAILVNVKNVKNVFNWTISILVLKIGHLYDTDV